MVIGLNDFEYHRYNGPSPPSDMHRYLFDVYASDGTLTIPAGSGKEELKQAMAGRILAYGVLIGHYQREKAV